MRKYENKTERLPSFMLQKEDTSSIPKRRPPTGAVKAEATPAAAPAAVKLRLWKNT